MKLISNCAADALSEAATVLKDGHLVAFPTETVYGIGADATNATAVGRMFSVKNRPKTHPVIVHISSINRLGYWAGEIPEYAQKLAGAFWPGPMTLILKRTNLASDFITGGQESVGLRVPQNKVALSLIQEFESLGGFGIAAPSANRFGSVSPTNASAVEVELGTFLGSKDLILDDGPCEIGIESTIIDCTQLNPVVLRPGAITKEMIEQFTNLIVTLKADKGKVRAPGLLKSHYAPKAKVILGLGANSGDGFIALANIATPVGSIRLATPASIEDYAKDLYSALRLGDELGLNRIFVVEPKGHGLAIAIRDRLVKASSGKGL